MATRNLKYPHAIMISFHLQGHIIPFVNLALTLASRGFSISFAHLDFIHHQISKSRLLTADADIFARARDSGLDIRYSTLDDGLPIVFDRSANYEQHLQSMMHRFPDRVDEFVGEIIRSQSLSPRNCFLIADTFSIWSPKIADKYGIVNVSFWTEAAMVFSLYHHRELLMRNGAVPVEGRRVDVDYVPGIPSINTKDFPSYLHDSELQLIHEIMFRAFDLVRTADFVLCNTVEELEANAVSALRETLPFYSIGPLFRADSNSIPRSLLPESDCSEWLDSRPPGSVLYISFGSLAKAEKNVVRAIAGGLLMSRVSFVWALRPGLVDSNGEDVLPEGFEERVKDRGVIVRWCNQSGVLANAATGGFLTHCGWNSVLESIQHGVPMICYPLFTDQMTNRKLVVDDWKVGMNLCKGEGEVITAEEVADNTGRLMANDELRKQILKLRDTLRNALDQNGSSTNHFQAFVGDLCEEMQSR